MKCSPLYALPACYKYSWPTRSKVGRTLSFIFTNVSLQNFFLCITRVFIEREPVRSVQMCTHVRSQIKEASRRYSPFPINEIVLSRLLFCSGLCQQWLSFSFRKTTQLQTAFAQLHSSRKPASPDVHTGTSSHHPQSPPKLSRYSINSSRVRACRSIPASLSLLNLWSSPMWMMGLYTV